jgi:uncharacterized membrane protein
MSLYTVIRHPHILRRREHGPVRLEREHIGFNGRLAAWITDRVGSMWTVYVCAGGTAVWMLLGSGRLYGFDPYPYPFLLFVGNLMQLSLMFVILLGQQILGRSADKRALQTYFDAEAILKDCEEIQNHLIAQDLHLDSCIDLPERDRKALVRAARRLPEPAKTEDAYVGRNGRLAAWLTRRIGTMAAFYGAVLFQLGWIALEQLHVITFDPYPYRFLLFLSSLAQLLLMVVIMVGQQVIGRAADSRAVQTFLDAEAVLHACERLQLHLKAQDVAIRHVVAHMETCKPRTDSYTAG